MTAAVRTVADASAALLAMQWEDAAGLVLAAIIVVYLVVVLIAPEKL